MVNLRKNYCTTVPPFAWQTADVVATQPCPLQEFWPLQELVAVLQEPWPLQLLIPEQCTVAAGAGVVAVVVWAKTAVAIKPATVVAMIIPVVLAFIDNFLINEVVED